MNDTIIIYEDCLPCIRRLYAMDSEIKKVPIISAEFIRPIEIPILILECTKRPEIYIDFSRPKSWISTYPKHNKKKHRK